MQKKLLSAIKLGAALFTAVLCFNAQSTTSEAAFDAPYYNINTNGGEFKDDHYVLNGETIKNAFFCDGTYTYFLQADGTPMKDRLTYHPDGVKVIYFDANGHEVFDNFAHVKKSIEGKDVDDLCYFGTYGELYVNVLTYNKEGTAIYYANPYGVMPRGGVFEIDPNAKNYDALAKGMLYGVANADGTVAGFYSNYESAVSGVEVEVEEEHGVARYWSNFGSITYDGNGKQISRTTYEDLERNIRCTYITKEDGTEYLSSKDHYFYDANGEYCGYESQSWRLKEDNTTYLSSEYKYNCAPGTDYSSKSVRYDENGNVTSESVDTYKGKDILKSEYKSIGKYSTTSSVNTYNYENGKLVSDVEEYQSISKSSDGTEYVSKSKEISEYDANENIIKGTRYSYDEDGTEYLSGSVVYEYTTVAGESVLAKRSNYYKQYTYENGERKDPKDVLSYYYVYTYDENGNLVEEKDYDVLSANDPEKTEERLTWKSEKTYALINKSWRETKSFIYSFDYGAQELLPDSGSENTYENNVRTKYTYYVGNGKDWKVIKTEIYNTDKLPDVDAAKPGDIITKEYVKKYDGEGNLTQYQVNYYTLVEYEY